MKKVKVVTGNKGSYEIKEYEGEYSIRLCLGVGASNLKNLKGKLLEGAQKNFKAGKVKGEWATTSPVTMQQTKFENEKKEQITYWALSAPTIYLSEAEEVAVWGEIPPV